MYITLEQCVNANKGQAFKGIIHIGAHTAEEGPLYMSAGIQNVLWVEANKNLMKFIYDNTKFLSMHSKYLNATLSDVDNEEVVLHIANNGQSSSILELGVHATMYPHIKYVDNVPVRARRFDKIYRENIVDIDLNLYDFINIDVQGAELKVLKGFGDLFNKFPFKAVYTEVNYEHLYKDCCLVEEIDDYLSQYNFKRVLTCAPEGNWGDSLYLRNV